MLAGYPAQQLQDGLEARRFRPPCNTKLRTQSPWSGYKHGQGTRWDKWKASSQWADGSKVMMATFRSYSSKKQFKIRRQQFQIFY